MLTTAVSLGSVSSQPLRIRVPSKEGETFLLHKTPSMEPKAKLPDRSNLDAGRSLLSAKIKEYVPDTTTAQEWCKCFESFCGDEPHSAALFSDFCAMVYFRTTIPKGQPGRLEVSSVCTYLRYVVLKYKKYSVLPCFKAIETEAGSLGSQRKAPSACGEHLAKVQHWLQKGPAAKLKLRSAAWMQTTTGGRSIDVNRLRGGGLILENRQVKSVDWKWTKSIKRPSDAKTVFPPRPIRDAVGPAPFTAAQWKLWSGQDGMARPFATFTSAEVNDELEILSEGFDLKLTSTSLRDVYNRLVADFCDNDAEKMKQYTPHKSAKSLSSSYLSGRKVSIKKSAAKKSAVKAPKKN